MPGRRIRGADRAHGRPRASARWGVLRGGEPAFRRRGRTRTAKPGRSGAALRNTHEALARTGGHLPMHASLQAAADTSGHAANAKEPAPCRHSQIPNRTTNGRTRTGNVVPSAVPRANPFGVSQPASGTLPWLGKRLPTGRFSPIGRPRRVSPAQPRLPRNPARNAVRRRFPRGTHLPRWSSGH